MNDLKVMTLNIWNGGMASSFQKRAASIQAMIHWHDPDIIGIQELTEPMLKDLSELAETYTFYGKARGSHGRSDERCCVLFRKSRFSFLDGETFWLSATPDKPGSSFANSMFPRIATIAFLQDNLSGMQFTFANTHLDHLLPTVRTKQIEVLCAQLKQKQRGSFTVLTGDFNCSFPSTAFRLLEKDAQLNLKDTVPTDGVTTLRSFIQAGSSRFRPIDHILVSQEMTVIKSEIITGMYMGRYPSDHNPVLTVLQLPEPEYETYGDAE